LMTTKVSQQQLLGNKEMETNMNGLERERFLAALPAPATTMSRGMGILGRKP
jgi:hypothetical protein